MRNKFKVNKIDTGWTVFLVDFIGWINPRSWKEKHGRAATVTALP
jgi:hypothetical protein